jgi:hypothetical protein
MADTKITALAAITTVDPAADVLPIVDISDTSMAASGTTKKITTNQLLGSGATATLASATITGDLTVDTNVLKVDSANNRVTVGTLSAYGRFTVGVGSGLQAGTTTNLAYGLVDIDYATTGDINTRFSFVNSNGVTNAAIARIGNPNFNDNGNLAFLTRSGAGSLTERYRIAHDGVATWSEVGGIAGTAMTLNSTGLGVGVTPSAWAAGSKALQISSFFAAWQGSNGSSNLGFAVYEGGANTYNYRTTGDAPTFYSQLTGTHRWYTAPSGTAGNAITFTQAMTLDASGNLLVGTTTNTGSARIYTEVNGNGHVVKQLSAGGYCFGANAFSNGGTYYLTYFEAGGTAVGSITSNGTGVTYGTLSDYRLKESVAPLNGGLARVNALKPSIYKWKSNGSDGEGFLAHELAEVVPSAVTGEKDAVNEDGSIKAQGVDLSKVVPILVSAIKELTARVEALEA